MIVLHMFIYIYISLCGKVSVFSMIVLTRGCRYISLGDYCNIVPSVKPQVSK